MSVIQASCLGKNFRRAPLSIIDLMRPTRKREKYISAISDLNLSVQPGEFIGLLGENGAGKSTLTKLLCGVLAPTVGQVRVFGLDPQRERVTLNQRISAVFGQRTQLWWDLPVFRSFRMLAAIYGMNTAAYKKRIGYLSECLDLEALMDRPVRNLSLGQRVRCDIAAGLIHSPDLLFLDEPTIGLDAKTKRLVRKFLANENTMNGLTVILTSHDFQDIESLAQRIVVLETGKVKQDALVTDITTQIGGDKSVRVEFFNEIQREFPHQFSMRSDEGRTLVFNYFAKEISDIEVFDTFIKSGDVVDLQIKSLGVQDLIQA